MCNVSAVMRWEIITNYCVNVRSTTCPLSRVLVGRDETRSLFISMFVTYESGDFFKSASLMTCYALIAEYLT